MVYMLLANGFEEVEALAPLDFLRRAGVAIKTVSIGAQVVLGAHKIPVTADLSVDEVDFSDATMLILPGGMPGTTNLDAFPAMTDILRTVYDKGGYLAAICAAPLILGKRGYLKGKEAICYPGFESDLIEATLSDKPVVVDGHVVTARSAGVAWEFGYRLAELLAGKETSESVRKGLFLPEFGG